MAVTNYQHKPGTLDYFINLPSEKLILAERKHWIIVSYSLSSLVFFSFIFYFVSYILLIKLAHLPDIFIATVLVITCLIISFMVKIIADWYFHLFIVTNKKILEVYYSPLFFYKYNVVLLDQVRCTEIDEKKRGVLNELIDMGDIIITFDRPTHQEEFIITDVKNPRELALTLSNFFANLETNSNQPIWFKTSNINSVKRQSFGRYSLGGRI